MSEMKCYTICIPNSCLHIYYFPFNQAYMISDVCCCKKIGSKCEYQLRVADRENRYIKKPTNNEHIKGMKCPTVL